MDHDYIDGEYTVIDKKKKTTTNSRLYGNKQEERGTASGSCAASSARYRQRPNTNGQRSNPNGQRSNPNGQHPNTNGQRSNANGQRTNPNGQRSNPSGQRPNANGQRPNPNGPATRMSSNGKATRRKKKSSCFGSLLKFLLICLFILAGLAAILFAFSHHALSKLENDELDMSQIVVNTKDSNIENYTTIALFGVDSQDNVIHDIGSRTDSIIVASINNKTKDVKLMSIYRDTYASIDGQYDKINAAYSYGGPELAISTINRNLDLNITDYATVNFKALADAVDILGGIELTVESEKELENLNDYIGNMNHINGGNSKKFDSIGTYTFDGNQAVAYSRIRYMAGGDHARANHQRLVIQGIVKQLKKKPWKVGALLDTVLPQCKTSLDAKEMTSLGIALPLYSITDSQAYPFHSQDERYNGIYYGFALTVYSNVQQAHEYLYNTKDYEPTEELGRISEKVKIVTDAIGIY